MSLSSLLFVFFLPLVVVINFIFPKKYRYIWLFIASCVFYLSNDVRFLVGLLICTVTTYVTALTLEKRSILRRKVLLSLCIGGNILALLLFRYSLLNSLFVPIGMSFYTLQAMGYLIDVYRKKIEPEKNLIKYALFVCFFPTVMSGPIQRATGLLKQIKEGRDFEYSKARAGLYYLLKGYLLKFVIANQLNVMVNYAYGSYESMPGATLLWATALYAIQLYCDFAGYSALAIGTSKMLGFDLDENFSQPYFATSIKDFWRRWHISLSSWLKDYIYISLGGNRRGKYRTYINLMITFLVSGLWHGSGLNFLVWGALHGSYQIAESIIPKRSDKKNNIVCRVFRGMFTFVMVDFAWLFFRAESLEQALNILKRICFNFGFKEMTYYGSYLLGGTKVNLLLMLVGIGIVFFVDLLHEKEIYLKDIAMYKIPIVIRWTMYIALTLLLLFVVVYNFGQAGSTFIYERF